MAELNERPYGTSGNRTPFSPEDLARVHKRISEAADDLIQRAFDAEHDIHCDYTVDDLRQMRADAELLKRYAERPPWRLG